MGPFPRWRRLGVLEAPMTMLMMLLLAVIATVVGADKHDLG
jgi:hypothetical protein